MRAEGKNDDQGERDDHQGCFDAAPVRRPMTKYDKEIVWATPFRDPLGCFWCPPGARSFLFSGAH